MKVTYHQVTRTAQESFRVLELRGPNYNCTWHFHPEYQLGLIVKGSGHRIVGDNISPLEPGELSLLGPNLPHAWQFEDPPHGRARELHGIIIYFKEDSLGQDFFKRPEAERVRQLLNRTTAGLQVLGKTRRTASALIQSMVSHEGFQRVLDLLQLLHLLANSEELVPICSLGFMPTLPDQQGERLRKVCDLIQQRLTEPIHRDEIAKLAHFSPGAFSRFFKARTGKTFHEFVNELRIGRACRLLSEHELNITEVALACGFGNVTSFQPRLSSSQGNEPNRFSQEASGDELKRAKNAQTKSASDAQTARAELKTMLKSIDDRKIAIQLAADAQWPHSDAANAAIRREFGLSPKAAFLA